MKQKKEKEQLFMSNSHNNLLNIDKEYTIHNRIIGYIKRNIDRFKLPILFTSIILVYYGCDKKNGEHTNQNHQATSEHVDHKAKNPKEASEAKKKDVTTKGEATATQRELFSDAKTAFLANNLQKAEVLFKKLISTAPHSPEKESGMIALSQIYRETDRNQDAIDLLRQLLQISPELPEPYFMLARIYASQDQIEPASKMYQNLLAKQPNYLTAYVELASLYHMLGDQEKSVKTLRDYERRVFSFAKTLENQKAPYEKKKYAIEVLSLVSDERATQAFHVALRDPDPSIRFAVVIALGDEPPEVETLKILEQVAKGDPSLEVRLGAKDALERLQGLETFPPR